MTASFLAPLALAAFALGTAASAAGLDGWRWKARPVLVFAPSADAPAAADQIARLKAAGPALEEREMPVVVVTPDRVLPVAGDPPPQPLDPQALRKTYGVREDGFVLVLVGKDGGEKLRAAAPVDADRLTELVDTMPMRRSESR